MTTAETADRAAIVPQRVTAPLTPAAIFLVVTLNPGADNCVTTRALCADLGAIQHAVGFRDLEGGLSCVMAFGSEAWDRLFGSKRPMELHSFREIRAGSHHAPATPGDILFHIRARRMDLCFELARRIMERLGDAVSPADEVQGFTYFDQRDLLGFVDGSENPAGEEAAEFALVGEEDPDFAGGSYVVVQKYLHDLAGWNALSTETQEAVIGRTKATDIELDDAVRPTRSHVSLNTIVEGGQEVKILRANMVFGAAGSGEFGTYFIGYSRSPRTIEQMLENMFVGRPPGNYDRILDFSRAVTGNLFFAPSASFLDNLAEAAPAAANAAQAPDPPVTDGSLGIGSLKGKS
jgi:putative iron-dependent peroxidase